MILTPAPVLPRLPQHDFQQLCVSIEENGVLVPILATDQGIVIDGHERLRAAHQVGRSRFPIRVIGNLSEDERREMALRCNIERRHMSRAERRRLLEEILRASPSKSTREVADLLRISNATVSRTRTRLGVTSATPETIRGRDGKNYKYKPAYSSETKVQATEAGRLLAELGSDAPCGGVSLRRLRSLAYRKRAEGIAAEPADKLPSSIQIEHCDFRRLEEIVGDLTEAVDLALLDPPWVSEWYGNLPNLAAMTKRILRVNGIAAVYCGQASLPTFLSSFTSAGLAYRWIVACRNGTILRPRRAGGHIKSHWRSLILLSRGAFQPPHFLHDLLELADAEDRYQHPLNWNQPLAENLHVIERLTRPGALVADLTCGSGTAAAATVRAGGGRRFVGCEIDLECVKIARKRTADALLEESVA